MTIANNQSKLNRLYELLVKQAKRADGSPRRAALPGGANICITVNGDKRLVTFSRNGKRLGDTELATFRAHCEIPEHAIRIPEEGQAQRTRRVTTDDDLEMEYVQWYVVGYEWREL